MEFVRRFFDIRGICDPDASGHGRDTTPQLAALASCLYIDLSRSVLGVYFTEWRQKNSRRHIGIGAGYVDLRPPVESSDRSYRRVALPGCDYCPIPGCP